MQALVWIFRFVIVVILLWFALKNTDLVKIFGFPGQVWEAPLVFVILVAFVAGVVIGLLAWVPTVMRQRREISRLRRSAVQAAAVAAITPPPVTDVSATDVHGI